MSTKVLTVVINDNESNTEDDIIKSIQNVYGVTTVVTDGDVIKVVKQQLKKEIFEKIGVI
jgi:copper chaperone CopZ